MIDYSKIIAEHQQISDALSAPDVLSDQKRYQRFSKRFSFLEKIILLIRKYENLSREVNHLKDVVADSNEEADFKSMAKEELKEKEPLLLVMSEDIEDMLFGEHEPDNDFMVEIRSAAGGEEAALFAGDLYGMYTRYIEKMGWKYEILDSNPTDIGGYKEVIFSVSGAGAWAHFQFESGVHRVQRVPKTEASGRIHTSTITVASLVEPQDVELDIKPDDLKIDTYRASGAGGQHVNRTDSAVRITHLPTGVVVACQDERSQIKNRAKAMRILKAKLLDEMKRREQSKVAAVRKMQVGSGDRSEKIRTYNFPENRVTDHRINFTIYQLDRVLMGDMDAVIKALRKAVREKFYASQGLAKTE
jgi:peptide chain release factor 1